MNKVLVTGATGFIGQHVVRELLRQGYTVVATSIHADRAVSCDWYADVTYIPFDFAQFDPGVNYRAFFDHPDALIHLAWEGLPQYTAPFHIDSNLPRHLTLLTNLIEQGVRDITVTGTCFEYGITEGCLSEDLVPAPANAYAIAKDRLRQALELLLPGQLRWARLFYMYGRGQHPNSLFSQLETALAAGASVFPMSGGQQERDYLPVERVAAFIVAIAAQQTVTGIINVCSGEPITVQAMVERYLAETNRAITLQLGVYPYSPLEPMRFWGNPAKLQRVLQQTVNNP
jgi:nucleoside-diphosphate-sugar epimerase